MPSSIERWAIRLAARRGFHVSRFSTEPEIRGLIKLLSPLDTGIPLLRLGGDHDGGYVVPDDLAGIDCCFSPGVSDVADFELSLANRGIRCFLADASVAGPPCSHPLFDFEQVFLGSRNSSKVMTLETWVSRKPAFGDLILQMDIEGAENDVLFDTPSSLLRRFRIMVIEFHGLERLRCPDYLAYFRLLLEKVSRDFRVCHVHPNNCHRPVVIHGIEVPRIIEVSFLRKDRGTRSSPRSDFPHPLDRPNVPGLPDVVLTRDWFA